MGDEICIDLPPQNFEKFNQITADLNWEQNSLTKTTFTYKNNAQKDNTEMNH